jgi:hypothetical protein
VPGRSSDLILSLKPSRHAGMSAVSSLPLRLDSLTSGQ